MGRTPGARQRRERGFAVLGMEAMTEQPTEFAFDGLKTQIDQLRGLVDSLYREKVEVLNRGKAPCAHVTLGPRYLPCPHPDCTTIRNGRIHVALVKNEKWPVAFWTGIGQFDPMDPGMYRQERWERLEIQSPETGRWWAWRKA